jgi:hypothetical protein
LYVAVGVGLGAELCAAVLLPLLLALPVPQAAANSAVVTIVTAAATAHLRGRPCCTHLFRGIVGLNSLRWWPKDIGPAISLVTGKL